MTYFHINRAESYIQSLGFGDATANGINDRTQVAVADAFKDDNSFYSPATRKIKYGSGGVDDAEDADVILARVRARHPGRPGSGVRGWQSGRVDRRGLRRLLGGRDVLPLTGHDRRR